MILLYKHGRGKEVISCCQPTNSLKIVYLQIVCFKDLRSLKAKMRVYEMQTCVNTSQVIGRFNIHLSLGSVYHHMHELCFKWIWPSGTSHYMRINTVDVYDPSGVFTPNGGSSHMSLAPSLSVFVVDDGISISTRNCLSCQHGLSLKDPSSMSLVGRSECAKEPFSRSREVVSMCLMQQIPLVVADYMPHKCGSSTCRG